MTVEKLSNEEAVLGFNINPTLRGFNLHPVLGWVRSYVHVSGGYSDGGRITRKGVDFCFPNGGEASVEVLSLYDGDYRHSGGSIPERCGLVKPIGDAGGITLGITCKALAEVASATGLSEDVLCEGILAEIGPKFIAARNTDCSRMMKINSSRSF